jgi:hypothetical protein
MGPERFAREAGLTPVQRDEYGMLYRLDDGTQMVEVVNGTAEEDGSHKHYFIPCGPSDEIKTAHEAVAETYGLRAQQYRPQSRT